AGGLDDKDVRAPHVFLDFDPAFSVAERRHRRLPQLHAKIGANFVGEGQIRVARENHQFSAHRSPRSSDTSTGSPELVRGSSRRRASVGVTLEPAYLVRCTLLRKPTKGLNCNGIWGSLSTNCPIRQLIQGDGERPGTG